MTRGLSEMGTSTLKKFDHLHSTDSDHEVLEQFDWNLCFWIWLKGLVPYRV